MAKVPPAAMVKVEPGGLVGMAPSTEVKAGNPALGLEKASLTEAPAAAAAADTTLTADYANARQAISLYRKGAVAAGDEFAKTVTTPLVRTTLEWVALRFDPREAGAARLAAFAATHPDWPTLPWLRRRIEELSVTDMHDPAALKARFGSAAPETFVARLALARADVATGDKTAAAAIISDIWRKADLTTVEEGLVLKEFGALISRDDHKYRADRLLYKEQVQPALRAAALAGPDVLLLAKARASVLAQAGTPASDTALAAVPKGLVNDPGLLFARIGRARRTNRLKDAVDLMATAPKDVSALIDGDAWWVERRLLARKLLDAGDAPSALQVCEHHQAQSDAARIEAEFHTGWIALRFLHDPKTASVHFARAALTAETPISQSRAAYWQARAAEEAGDKARADKYYAIAAAQSISFYGQLAGDKIGRAAIDLRRPPAAATGDSRREAIRVIELLYDLGERDIAWPLAFEIAKTDPSDAQVAALGAVLARMNDARATLLVGKFATQRGVPVDETAFPTFGIPNYQPLTNSADRAVVYAIARQESEFDPRSVSSAGAKGLMQLISSTARITATRLGVGYDDKRLLNDAAFNAQIGAAHLGQLLAEQGGSYILTFAAYNAGSGRVKDWIDTYGDPRKPGVDPVDWIERIPFTETRNYVQRVFENLQIYRVRFGQSGERLVGADLQSGRKGT
ncbi:MAG: lytic transglycosylase domain-containing protein [Parafilimonas terrae]|nr:lytic transglycosylase domain-containing protein [Parafilimonas terrae]